MSGGSGRYLSGEDLTTLREKALQALVSEEAAAGINSLLAEQLSEAERDPDLIRSYLDAIQSVIEDLVEARVDVVFGGSVAKHTYVDGISDVDSLVVLKEGSVPGDSPGEVVEAFAAALRERLAGRVRSVEAGSMAVAITFTDGTEVDVLPALRRDGVSIASPDGRTWASIRPERFAAKLSNVNEQMHGKLVPTIKLAKSLLSALPQTRSLTGYHVESLAIEAFDGYVGPRTFRDLLVRFFRDAAERVLAPIRDSTGQSVHVDGYLGAQRSVERRLRADALGKLSRRIEAANTVEKWRALLSETEL